MAVMREENNLKALKTKCFQGLIYNGELYYQVQHFNKKIEVHTNLW
jgi:hypothetical protein